MSESSEPPELHQALTPERLAELEADYSSYPDFGEWISQVGSADPTAWTAYRTRLRDARGAAAEEAVSTASEMVLRAAAFDTGAIEGLYTTNRGITMSVALQEPNWERDAEAQSPNALSLFD